MTAFGNDRPIAELRTIPSVRANIPGASVAWHSKPGQRGGIFAELYKGPDTDNESTACHVSYLTPLQLALMSATEGPSYVIARVDAHVATHVVEAYAIVATSSHILLAENHKPVRVVRDNEPLPEDSMSAEEALNYMLANAAGAVESTTATELLAEMQSVPLDQKKLKQEAVRLVLHNAGLSINFDFPATHTGFKMRGDLNFKPGLLQLMEQVVQPLRPADLALRHNRKTDIAQELRRRAHDELAIYLARNPA